MGKEKIIIQDSKRNPQMVIMKDHPFFEQIKRSMMPDEYRIKQREISNLDESLIEESINDYYESIQNPNIELNGIKGTGLFSPLMPIGIMND